jgi:4,5-DOPA dioxygenase extradiol
VIGKINNYIGPQLTDVSFYGFPANYYKEKFPNKGSKEVAERVTTLLNNAGIKTHAMRRGLDHGAWACFKVGKCLMIPVKLYMWD